MFQKGIKHKKRKYRNGQTRLMEVPIKYQQGFMKGMDTRTAKFHNLDKSFQQIIRDMGGKENISRLELGLIERFVYCEYLIRQVEYEMSQSDNGIKGKLLGRWIKLDNAINSICAKLGISKRSTGKSELTDYLSEQEQE